MSVVTTFPLQNEAYPIASDTERTEPGSESLSDPEVDTPMIITLDRLRPYDLDPRVTRNPRYDEIRESIRGRGLDAPPPITRRPGESFYRIRNGGNTRLSILRELWSETKNEQYFHLTCVFRPWPKRGEIIALTGHLAENELRGGLTFIERALGVEKARELYELECGFPLSQSELSRRLTSDGYPIQQSHISRMHDAVQYLLPAIPNVLYGGLGRHQVERLAVMRRSCEKIWEQHAKSIASGIDFPSLFHEALMMFDSAAAEFSIARVQDELIGQMALWLGVDYDTLALASNEGEKRQQALSKEPHSTPTPDQFKMPIPALSLNLPGAPASKPSGSENNTSDTKNKDKDAPGSLANDRLQSIQELVARHAGDEPKLQSDVLPFSQASLFPISDIWNIDPGLDEPERLRIHIGQFAREIAQDASQADFITEVDEGIGFRCSLEAAPDHQPPSTLLALLETLTTSTPKTAIPMEIGALLLGSTEPCSHANRLSDASLVKLFRLIRLARRLIDLKSDVDLNTVMQ
ncbi:ParB family protein [Pseudomonas lini]